jgi:hypothetical protein
MRKLSAGVALLVVAGCVHTNAAVMDPSAKYEKTCPEAVVMYTSVDKVGKNYREVALLNSAGNTAWTSEKGMYNSQRKKAASLGANGIILNDINEPKAGTKIIGAVLGTGAERKGGAMAIYVPEDSVKTAEVCRTKKA